MKALLLGFFFSLSLFFSPVQAEENITLDLFYGAECPHCHKEMKWLEEVSPQFPELTINKYEVWHDEENKALWKKRMAEFGEEAKYVPTNIMAGEVLVGFDPEKLQEMFLKNMGRTAEVNETNETSWKEYLKNYSWPAMAIMLGAVDGFNPCAMWSLMILIGFLMSMENKRHRWLVGIIFLASSGILYGAALLGYLFGFSQISNVLSGASVVWLFRLVGLFAIVAAGFSFYAFWKNKVECEIRDGGEKKKFHDRLQNIFKKENLFVIIPGVIVLAFSVNSIELLCSFAIPTAFTATLLSLDLSFASQLSAILLYDLAYMADDIIVFLVAMFTLSYVNFSPKLVRGSHLVGGGILLILGAFLIGNTEALTQWLS